MPRKKTTSKKGQGATSLEAIEDLQTCMADCEKRLGAACVGLKTIAILFGPKYFYIAIAGYSMVSLAHLPCGRFAGFSWVFIGLNKLFAQKCCQWGSNGLKSVHYGYRDALQGVDL